MNTRTVIGYDLIQFGGFWAVVAFFSTRAPGHPMVRNAVRVMAMCAGGSPASFERAMVIWAVLLGGRARELPVVVERHAGEKRAYRRRVRTQGSRV